MKRLSVVFCIIFTLILVFGLISCDNEEEGNTYTVSFMVGDELFHTVSVADGEGLSLVAVTDESFKGWYYDQAFMFPAKDGDTVKSDTILYAYIGEHVHSYQKANVHAPTCTAEGYTLYLCACGENYRGDILEATGHIYKEKVFDSSCTTYGFRQFTCSCGHYYREEIEPKGHSYTSEVIDPTTDSGGYTLHTCESCGHTYSDNFTPIIPHDHDFEVQETPATCTESGEIIRACKLCILVLTDTIEPKGHSYDATVYPPTTTQGGYTEYICRDCDHTYCDNFCDPIPEGHVHLWANDIKEPTCLEGGYTTHSCSECGFSYKDTYTEATGHQYEELVFPPTEQNEGWTQYTCIGCGDAYVGNFVPPHRHSYTSSKIHPTCTTWGYTVFTCTECGYSYEGNGTEPQGHYYKSVVTEPTCTTEGYTTYICQRCEHTYEDNRVSALDHSYEVKDYVPSTCQTIGYYILVCVKCDNEYRQNEQGLGNHKYKGTIVEPTCLNSGYTDYNCEYCNATYQDDYQPPLDHDFDLSWVQATCTETGYTIHECRRCNYHYFDGYTEPIGHHTSEWGYNENEHYRVCIFCHNYTERHENHYALNCECGYIHPVGTLWFWNEGDSYLYYQYQKPERGLLDIVIPATYKGKPVRFSFASIDDGVKSLTVEKGVILEATGDVIPEFNNLEEIYFYCDAFEDNGHSWLLGSCKNLKKLVLPRNMKIARGLHSCNIEELYVPATLRSFSGEDTQIKAIYYEGTLSEFVEFDESVETLLSSAEELYINGKLVKDLVITDEITSLGNYSFKGCKSIESVTFENTSPIAMGEGVFEGCVNLKNVTLSQGVQTLGGAAFKDCTSLENVNFAEGLTKISYSAFKNCVSLESAVLPKSLDEIDAQIFFGCESLKYVYLTDINTITQISSSWQAEGYSIFDSKSTAVLLLEDDDIAGSAESYLINTNRYLTYDEFDCQSPLGREHNAYFGASSDDYFESGEFSYVRVGDNAHVIKYLGDSENVSIPSKVTYKGQELTVTELKNYCLAGSGAKSLHIPSTVYNVYTLGTDTLENITVDANNKFLASRDGVLYTSTMKTLISYPSKKQGSTFEVPSTVKVIRAHAFACPEYLEYVYVPEASSIEAEAFVSQRNIVVGTDNSENIYNQYGIIAVSGGNIQSTHIANTNDASYLLNDGYAQLVSYYGDARELSVPAQITVNGSTYKVSGIFSGAFYQNNTLERVVLEEGIEIVGSYSNGWEMPKDYKFDGEFAKEFRACEFENRYAFYGCTSLKEIILPSTVTHVYGLARDCEILERVELGQGLKYIHTGIVNSNCLTKMTFPKSIVRMGEGTLTDCDNMEEITIGTLGMTKHNENATMIIDSFAIWLETPLKKVVLGDEVKTYNSPSRTCPFGTEVDVFYLGAGTSDKTADGYEELHFYGDMSEYLSKPVNTRPKHLYLEGELLSGTVYFDKATIQGLDMRLCENLDITHIVLTEDGTEVIYGQFKYCTNLKELTVKGKNVVIDRFAFTHVRTLVVEGSIAQMGENAFENLSKVVVASIEDWMNINYVRNQTSSIMVDGADFYLLGEDTPCYEIVIPESITTIKSFVFAGLDFNKYSIVMHNKVTTVEACAFANTSYYDTDALSGLDTTGWYWAYESNAEALYAYDGEDLHLDMLKKRDRYWFKLN